MKRKIISIMLTFAMVFAVVPAFSQVDAATYKIKTLSATAKSTSSVALKWSKTTVKSKKFTGYAIFRNGKLVKHVSKKTLAYTDTKLKANTSYTYVIKTYKAKKVKQWFNKKTGKWQKKKPAKKYRGKSRKVTTYTYANPSPTKNVKTKANSSNASSGSNGSSNGSNTSSSNTSSSSNTTKTITSYTGKEREVYYVSNSKYTSDGWYLSSGSYLCANSQIAQYDRTIDGTWKDGGSKTFVQKNGVTFNVTNIKNATALDDGKVYGSKTETLSFDVDVYNGEIDKLTFNLKNSSQVVNTYTYDKEPCAVNFVMANGERLASYSLKTSTGKVSATKTLKFYATGFAKGDAIFDVCYNGNKLGTITISVNPNAGSDGLVQQRKDALEIASAAITQYGDNGYNNNMNNISKYIRENLSKYNSYKTLSCMDCTFSAFILETYSVQCGQYGFMSYGSQGPGMANYGSHIAFHLESNPNVYYESAGY